MTAAGINLGTIGPIDGQNWMITPAALAAGERPPANIHDQQWLCVLTGVVEVNFQGSSTSQWRNATATIMPDMGTPGQPNSGPLWGAIQQHSIPIPPLLPGWNGVYPYFSLTGWAPFVSLSSIYDAAESINAGYAVNLWRPNQFTSQLDVLTQQGVGNIFTGVNVDLAVRDTDGYILKLAYNITLLGRIVFAAIDPV